MLVGVCFGIAGLALLGLGAYIGSVHTYNHHVVKKDRRHKSIDTRVTHGVVFHDETLDEITWEKARKLLAINGASVAISPKSRKDNEWSVWIEKERIRKWKLSIDGSEIEDAYIVMETQGFSTIGPDIPIRLAAALVLAGNGRVEVLSPEEEIRQEAAEYLQKPEEDVEDSEVQAYLDLCTSGVI